MKVNPLPSQRGDSWPPFGTIFIRDWFFLFLEYLIDFLISNSYLLHLSLTILFSKFPSFVSVQCVRQVIKIFVIETCFHSQKKFIDKVEVTSVKKRIIKFTLNSIKRYLITCPDKSWRMHLGEDRFNKKC